MTDDTKDRAGTHPRQQWWVLNGEDLLSNLKRASAGEQPELLYIEMVANSATERPCPSTDHPVWADGSQDHYRCRLAQGHAGAHQSTEDDGAWEWL
jgi:hypothetical protein